MTALCLSVCVCVLVRWAGLWLRELSGLTVILSSAFSLVCTLALGIGLQGGVLPGLNWLFSYVTLLQLTCITCGLAVNVPYHAYASCSSVSRQMVGAAAGVS